MICTSWQPKSRMTLAFWFFSVRIYKMPRSCDLGLFHCSKTTVTNCCSALSCISWVQLVLVIFSFGFRQLSVIPRIIDYKRRAVARRTARCRCKFRYVGLSHFTTAPCSFSATSRFSCIGLGYISDLSNAEITHSTLISTAVTQNHDDSFGFEALCPWLTVLQVTTRNTYLGV